MSHRNLQGAPTESSENSSNGRIPLRIQKDKLKIARRGPTLLATVGPRLEPFSNINKHMRSD